MPSSSTKPFTRSSLGLNTYIIRQAALVLTVLLLVLPAKADDWQISQDENYISLSKNGEIQHGNKIYFNFDKQNACKFNVFFFIYTMAENPEPLSIIYEDREIDLKLGGIQIPALLNFSEPLLLGQIAGIYVAQNTLLSKEFISLTEDMLQDNMMHMEFTGDHIQYFDIPQEKWNFKEIEKNLHKSHNLCILSKA